MVHINGDDLVTVFSQSLCQPALPAPNVKCPAAGRRNHSQNSVMVMGIVIPTQYLRAYQHLWAHRDVAADSPSTKTPNFTYCVQPSGDRDS